MVAHRLVTAVQYCDYIMVLDKGKLVQFGKPASLLLQDPESDDKVTK